MNNNNSSGGAREPALKLWRHLFGDEQGLLCIFSGRREGKELVETKESYFRYPDDEEAAAALALRESSKGRESYFCAHLLNGPRRIKENAAPVRALWGDLDGAPVPNGNLKPSAIVESSPGHYHAYWRLTDAIPPEVAEQLNKRIAAEIGADSSGFDLSQLLRVPGATNFKRTVPEPVKLTGLSTSRAYSSRQLDKLLPPLQEELGHDRPQGGEGNVPPVLLDEEALKVYWGERYKTKEDGSPDRSASLLMIGRVLYDAGANRPVIVAALRERDETLGWRCYTDRRDADKQYQAIVGELEKNGRKKRRDFRVGPPPPPTPPPAETPSKGGDWPELADEALYGLAGDIVRTIHPLTESPPVAILATLLTAFGNACGRGAHIKVGPAPHYLNIFAALVGESSKARKGTSWGYVRNLVHAADKYWTEERVVNGLSSGEGLIYAVRDATYKRNKSGEEIVEDEGVQDKRLLVLEPELASTLKVAGRQGNIVSAVIRQAWDGERLQSLTRNNPLKATGAHVSIVGHITKDELLRNLTETEAANGFANRFLWIAVKRDKLLPFAGVWGEHDAAPLVGRLTSALGFGKKHREIRWGEDAREMWIRVYGPLSEGQPGLYGAATGRAEAQVVRLAALYATLDASTEINAHHLKAALALWDYADESARYIFGDATGDAVADRILDALRATPQGLKRTEISALFGRHRDATEIARALALLLTTGKARGVEESTGGRSAERWYAA